MSTPTISMNAWLCEKALHQVKAACRLQYKDRYDSWTIYYSACLFLAYATGDLSDDIPQKATIAFDAGPQAMMAYAEELSVQPHEGWDLPNPQYHSLVVGIIAPGTDVDHED